MIKKVYGIVGAPYVGKTTICQAITQKTPLWKHISVSSILIKKAREMGIDVCKDADGRQILKSIGYMINIPSLVCDEVITASEPYILVDAVRQVELYNLLKSLYGENYKTVIIERNFELIRNTVGMERIVDVLYTDELKQLSEVYARATEENNVIIIPNVSPDSPSYIADLFIHNFGMFFR